MRKSITKRVLSLFLAIALMASGILTETLLVNAAEEITETDMLEDPDQVTETEEDETG